MVSPAFVLAFGKAVRAYHLQAASIVAALGNLFGFTQDFQARSTFNDLWGNAFGFQEFQVVLSNGLVQISLADVIEPADFDCGQFICPDAAVDRAGGNTEEIRDLLDTQQVGSWSHMTCLPTVLVSVNVHNCTLYDCAVKGNRRYCVTKVQSLRSHEREKRTPDIRAH